MGGSPRQANILRAVEYRPTGTENNKCRRCTVPYYSTCNSATHSKPGTGSTPEVRWYKKECNPRPDRFSIGSDPPSSLVTWNRPNSASTRLLGSWPFLSNPPTNRGGRGGLGSTMTVGGGRPSTGGITGSHEVCAWVGNQFREPAPRRGTKVKVASGAERCNSHVFAFPYILGPRLDPLPYFQGSDLLLSEGSQNTGYAWAHPMLNIS